MNKLDKVKKVIIKNKQKIKVSVKLNIKRKITSDKLTSTVCYQNILNSLENIHKYGHIKLVETLANKLAEEFQKINDVTKIKIKIVKCDISKKGKWEKEFKNVHLNA